MKIIGITGGVGAGKSRVLSYLQKEYGAYVCEADRVAWELQKPGEACYQQIVDIFGENILQEDGAIDRKALGGIVFSSPEQLMLLNHIMHSEVRKRIEHIIDEQRKGNTSIFVLEAALLLEAQYDQCCDEVWYIYADDTIRRERLIASRDYSLERIEGIMASQKKEDEFRQKCDRVIDNGGCFEETCRQIKEILE